MRLSSLVYFYARRLRTRPVQEVLAGIGIAVGVALVFAVQVANDSVIGASDQIVKSVVGAADLQLQARSSAGFDERLAARIRALPGVRVAAPVLSSTATVVGPNGRAITVQLASSDISIAAINGLRDVPLGASEPQGVVLPRATAQLLGAFRTLAGAIPGAAPVIQLQVRGRTVPVRVRAVLGAEVAGPLANALAVIAPLSAMQALAGLPHRITGVLVQSQPGRHAQVRRELKVLAAGRLTVGSPTEDVRLLRQATTPSAKATAFFSVVGGLVGILLAFNAMLLSVPERRRAIADLRIHGARPRDLVKLLLFQALCLGVLASAVGVLFGDVLSRHVFHQTPGYLTAAFPLGTQTVIGWRPVLFSMLGGIVATCLAAAPPLLDLRRSRAIDAVYSEEGEPGHGMSSRVRVWLFLASMSLLASSGAALLVLGPTAAIGAIVGLAALLAIPFTFTVVLWVAQLIASRAGRLNMLLMATRALRATTARSLALAATGAAALFGSVAINGAHRDLLNGLYGEYAQYVSTADLWVSNPRDDLATNGFPARDLSARIAHVPGVIAVRPYHGGYLDVAGRRTWILARSPSSRTMFPPGQIVSGRAELAERRLRSGGWITLSHQLAQATHTGIGAAVVLPTPSGPHVYRLAATTTNLGWPGGAIVLNDLDYRRAWGSSDPSALEVDLAPGADPSAVQRKVSALAGAGLSVQTPASRAAQADALAREALSRLTQIAWLLMIAAVLAMAAAMGASVWQRRPSLASLRIQSFRPAQLRMILLCESALVLATGALVGAGTGLYGHALIDRYLRLVTGFPAPFSPTVAQTFETIGLVLGAALVVLLLPGVIASRAPARLALQE
jgi:putative ABC transport system permease protein